MQYRLFFAFPVPPEITKRIASLQTGLKERLNGSKITWTSPETFHVTVHFLGSVDDTKLPAIVRMAALTARRQSAFFYTLNRLDVFPNFFSARVLTLSLMGGDPTSQEIHFQLLRGLQQLRITVNRRPWMPHITLGRIKSRLTNVRLPDVVVPPATWPITSIDLMSSELRPEGAVYTKLESFSLT